MNSSEVSLVILLVLCCNIGFCWGHPITTTQVKFVTGNSSNERELWIYFSQIELASERLVKCNIDNFKETSYRKNATIVCISYVHSDVTSNPSRNIYASFKAEQQKVATGGAQHGSLESTAGVFFNPEISLGFAIILMSIFGFTCCFVWCLFNV